MTRVNLLALAAAAGAQDDPAHLMRIKQSIARHQFADAWLIRARFYEVLANFEGDASKAQLEEGLNDADPNVRSIAAESLRRRRVRRTLTR
jgi:HEAT repeat protein